MRDWEDMWRRGETPWDRGDAAPPLLEYLGQRPGVAGLEVLVPGCGSGHDVRALARAGARVSGLDFSPAAVEVARGHDPAGGERYEVGDLFEWRGGVFDALWEHTCFCAIDPGDRPRYARAVADLIRPGGRLFGVFYLEPWGPDEIPDPPPFGTSRDEVVDLLRPEFELVWETVPSRSYPGREGREWLAEFQRRDRGVAKRPKDR